MKDNNINQKKITLQLSQNELGVICNALNEICHGIEVWEFDTRMGIKVEGARAILTNLINIYKTADADNSENLE